MDAGAPSHRKVKVKITIKPPMQGIPLKTKLYDPDDPSDADGPIDDDPNMGDNRGTPLGFLAGAITSKIVGNVAVAWEEFSVSLNPGDNFRLLAAPRDQDFNDIKVISSQTAPETQGRLYVDENDDGEYNNGDEPVVDEGNPAHAAIFSTPLLTVWRRLHVEVDSMGAPDPTKTYNYGVDDPPPNGDIPDPDTSKLADAFRDAFIDVSVITDSAISQGNLPFLPSFPDVASRVTYFHNARNTENEDAMYWTAYIIGLYELELGDFRYFDNDLNPGDMNHPNDGTNPGALGYTDDTGPDYSMIMTETIRDVADRFDWTAAEITYVQQLVAIHEIGHQFGLKHPSDHPANDPYEDYKDADTFPGSVMTFPATITLEAQSPDVELEFAEWAIAEIRDNFGSGQKP
jgi:hypothetical protein